MRRTIEILQLGVDLPAFLGKIWEKEHHAQEYPTSSEGTGTAQLLAMGYFHVTKKKKDAGEPHLLGDDEGRLHTASSSFPISSFGHILGFADSQPPDPVTPQTTIRQYFDDQNDAFNIAIEQEDREFALLKLIGRAVDDQDMAAARYMGLDYFKQLGNKVLRWTCHPHEILPQLIAPTVSFTLHGIKWTCSNLYPHYLVL